MKFIKLIITLTLVSLANVSYSQEYSKNIIELSFDIGLANDLGTLGTYRTPFLFEDVEIDSRRFARTQNFAFSFTRYFHRRNGIKISFGIAEYGFDFNGRLETSGTPINDFYRTSYLEWGFSYIHRIPVLPTLNLLLEPGIRYHSDGSGRSATINFAKLDSYSISSYMGVEIPMFGERFFANGGLQFKLPLQKYNFIFDSEAEFRPYFIGLKVGFNFQF